ncbi:uncharacterized protein NPIL_537691 [Nephila pilipes]|uniref:Uncharacterized protein n=1 Tax=Nephila pilipes TaxID=299642 RepID=A0A8X6NCZ0_NEPPI|nr:uncharacterized protein NPIL_537691 [Nephila pilipes]
MVTNITIEGKRVPINLIILPQAKGNKTLLGKEFIKSAGIVLDVFNGDHLPVALRKLHPISKSHNKKRQKYVLKREGPYLEVTNLSPTIYDIANPEKPDDVLGTCHMLAFQEYELPVSRDRGKE